MSESTAAPAPTPTAQPAEAGRQGETPEQTIAGLREALAKANTEAKENRLKAAELDKHKAAQMSDLERVQAELQDAKTQATAATAAALRWKIAASHGINDADAETFLTGSDEATLTRQATRLAEMRGAVDSPTTPKPDLTQGGTLPPPALNGDGLEAALRTKLGI